jgi:hypothetical protein
MADPAKAPKDGSDWHQAVLPNPFFVSEEAAEEPLLATVTNQKINPEVGSSRSPQAENHKLGSEGYTRQLLADFLPNFAGELPQPIPILDDFDEPQTPPKTESEFLNSDLSPRAVGSANGAPKLRGIGLIGAVFNVLSKQLGTEFSTAELMLAAQQLIDISKAEYVGIPYKDVAERAGYYSWDLVRAFSFHPWQIARVETKQMDHCDADEFAPESFETARLLIQGWGERTWEF